ncbi:DUF2254 domain-containing protein [Pseudohoeflea coraliihabitans]|uniref:DUF2254 domain-containing protein n=1 Tax=Pseudohoeflea coraliihabitans TaxID=2860393 RepID=A0ABS6WQF1_9HYPH|nr:DUF2254 domain-containing protein [Pseudohoeflea sp. DP4N28-3]MBW3097289.1 DUF2254 domain-containing protein [Pseudohoeflea sp. DP4N28-3]
MSMREGLKSVPQSIFMLLTVPSLIALGIAALPVPLYYIDSNFAEGFMSPFVLQIDPQSAHTLLAAVATGAVTALSLTYSLVLVVFTLAAGNIGPRLLRRFTTEPVNQVTAGILGGTFLYSLVTIMMIRQDFLPKFTISIAGFLAILSVLQLIYFVRHVSTSVTIDDEIAAISRKMAKSIRVLMKQDADRYSGEDEHDYHYAIRSETTGYVGHIDENAAISLATEQDLAVRLAQPAGFYLLRGEQLLLLNKEVDEDIAAKLLALVTIEQSRSDARNIEFSINLLIEIALRALSPGINDTYTARACLDSITSALSEPARQGLPTYRRCDDEGKLRLVVPGLSLQSMLDTAFHPLRRASRNNVMMAISVAQALERLANVGTEETRALVQVHEKLLMKTLEDAGHHEEDLAQVRAHLSAYR